MFLKSVGIPMRVSNEGPKITPGSVIHWGTHRTPHTAPLMAKIFTKEKGKGT